MLEQTLAVTGHRPARLGGYEGRNPLAIWVKHRLRDVLQVCWNEGFRSLISGGALGVDQWAAAIALEIGYDLTIARPFPSQDSVWPEASRQYYRELLEKATVVDVSPDPYHPSKLFARNQWLVDRCSCLIAVYDMGQGGTAWAYKYAQKKNKRIELINPLMYTGSAI